MRHSEQQTPDLDPEIARSALEDFYVNFIQFPIASGTGAGSGSGSGSALSENADPGPH
jgi:hypothetical protein